MSVFGFQPGQMIDEYKIISKIGKGGMATVYKAYQSSMDRYVAIKILSFQLADSEEFLGRFRQEARLIARLEHPNILPVYAYGEDRGIPFLVMRYLEAGTLKDYLRQKALLHKALPPGTPAGAPAGSYPRTPLALKEINSIFSQVAEALSYAHEKGVIHRDIKPSNVMLDRRGTAFLTDFGIAKLVEPSGDGTNIFRSETLPQFTATGAVTGTPDYMSPEQAQGLRLDQRSDIYSLGIVLYEMLTGKVPFEAETPMAVIMKQIAEPLPPPSLINPALHPALEAVVLKALEKNPELRFASMPEFLAAWKRAYSQAVSPEAELPESAPSAFIPETTPEESIQPPASPDLPGGLHGFEQEAPPETFAQPPTARPEPSRRLGQAQAEEDDAFVLKNLQISKTAAEKKPHHLDRRLLFLAGGIALVILAIIGLATALRLFDFLSLNNPASPQADRQPPAQVETTAGLRATSWAASNHFQALAIAEMQAGRFLIGGGGGGLTLFPLGSAQPPAGFQITTQQGLLSSQVSALALDEGEACGSQVCLWVGTDSGVTLAPLEDLAPVRSAPIEWVVYDEADGLDGGYISALFYKDGVLWAGTQYTYPGGGLQYFTDGLWQPVAGFPSSDQPGAQTVSYNVQQILVDEQDRLWVATQEGLCMQPVARVLQPSSASAWQVFKTEQGLPANDVLSLFEDSSGTLWAGTRDGGAASFDGERFIPLEGLRDKEVYDVTAIFQDAQDTFWFVGYNLAVFNPQNSDWQTFRLSNGTFPYENLRLGLFDPETGERFISSDGNGILRFADLLSLKQMDFKTLALPNLPRFGGYHRLLPAPASFGNRLIFIAANDSDLDVFDLDAQAWLPGSAFEGDLRWPTAPTPRLFDSQGNAWSGDWDGLWITSPDGATNWRQEDGLPSNHITAIALPPSQAVSSEAPAWIATEAGLAAFDGEKILFVDTPSNSGLPLSEISHLLLASDGNLWAANGTSLSRRAPSGDWENYSTEALTGNSAWITDLAEGKDHTLWVATHAGGLLHYQAGKWENLRATSPGSGLPSDQVNCLTIAPDGSLWIGLENKGAVRFDGSTWTPYLPGLIHPTVYDILVAADGSLWFATAGGITRLQP